MLETCDENANVVIEQWDGDTFGIGEVKLKIKFGKVLDLFFNGLNMD